MQAAQSVGQQFTRQAKGQVKTAHPVGRLRQPIAKGGQYVKGLQALQLHPALTGLAQRQHDGFAFGRAAGEIAADQCLHSHVSPYPKP
jgi:predicted DNA repair protein MutK